ncbi:MAG: anti-sigma factor [Vicinamibacteraceae bacterium]
MSVADREQLRELASLHALGVLSAEERAELTQAMAADADLAAEVRQLEDTAGALGGVVAQVDPPARLRARVLAVAGIEAEDAANAAPGSASVTAIGSRSRGGDGVAPGRGASHALPGWLAAAAALVLASGLGLWALQLRGSLEAMNARVDRAEAEVVRIQRTVDEAQQQTRVLQAHNSVLFAPDTLRVDLAGEGSAPTSKARAFMSRHSGLAFAADQLPALPADKVYQLWVVPQGDKPVPINAGLLAPDASGHASLFFDMPANVPLAAALAVTVEPAGGVPAPTGARVLLGAVPTATAS